MKLQTFGLVFILSSLMVVFLGSTHQVTEQNENILTKLLPSQLSDSQVYQTAKSITVRVLSQSDSIGSGILIERKKTIYFVLTNAHVIRSGKSTYQIQTSDSKIYPAQKVISINFGKDDLELLQFNSPNHSYPVVKLGQSSALSKGDKVFAAGFPLSLENSQPEKGFTFKVGTVVLILNKALEGGYQIGYTNEIEKGMSGGPLLNQQGELVGVNGIHANPLWDAPDYYEDGSEPTQSLQKIIVHSNWAVPLQKVIQSLPN